MCCCILAHGTLENGWLKQLPYLILSSKPNISKHIIDFNVIVIVFKLNPSSFT
jgi:hypothetical protein